MHISKTWPLRYLLMLLMLIVLLPLVVAGAWATKSTIDRQRKDTERSALELSRALSSAVDAELDATVSSLSTLSYAPSLRTNDLREFYRTSVAVLQARPGWRAIILTDGDGNVLFNTKFPYGDAPRRVIDEPSLQHAMASTVPVVGSVLEGRKGELAFPVRLPLIEHGKPAYVLTAAVMPDKILDIVRQQNAPAGWTIAVFDRSGKRIARSRDHHIAAASPTLAALLGQGRREGIGVTTTLEGIESLTAYTRIADSGWTVAVGISSAGLRTGLIHSLMLYLTALAASLAVYILLAAYITQRITTGIGDLREQSVKLIRGTGKLQPLASRIREVVEVDKALLALAEERKQIEAERAALLSSLNDALAKARQALAQAEEAARSKDVFLAILGHELRNPMAPIVSALDIMQLKGEESTRREREIMRRQVDHMRRLVDDLLDVSRIAQGKLEIHPVLTDMGEIVQRSIEAIQNTAQKQNATLEVKQPEGKIWANVDAARLVQAITNLLTNALRFAPSGKIQLLVQVSENEISIRVSDNGVGISSENMTRIFEPFFQAPQSIARSTGGLGLGLAIVKSIVELHGGRVSVSSGGVGTGSQFELRLPRAQGLPAESGGNGSGPKLVSKKILVVDDNTDAADTIAAGLGIAGHTTMVAYSGQDALRLFTSFQPDAVILDIGMPGMNGYDLAHAIRHDMPQWKGLLIALSGYGQEKDRLHAFAAGFDVHVVKPAKIDELLQRLCEWDAGK